MWCNYMALSRGKKSNRQHNSIGGFVSGAWGKRELFTKEGWRWRQAAMACQMFAVIGLVLWFLQGP